MGVTMNLKMQFRKFKMEHHDHSSCGHNHSHGHSHKQTNLKEYKIGTRPQDVPVDLENTLLGITSLLLMITISRDEESKSRCSVHSLSHSKEDRIYIA